LRVFLRGEISHAKQEVNEVFTTQRVVAMAEISAQRVEAQKFVEKQTDVVIDKAEKLGSSMILKNAVMAGASFVIARRLYAYFCKDKKEEGVNISKAQQALDIALVLFSIIVIAVGGGMKTVFDIHGTLCKYVMTAKAWLSGCSWLVSFLGMDVCGMKEAEKVSDCLSEAQAELFSNNPTGKPYTEEQKMNLAKEAGLVSDDHPGLGFKKNADESDEKVYPSVSASSMATGCVVPPISSSFVKATEVFMCSRCAAPDSSVCSCPKKTPEGFSDNFKLKWKNMVDGLSDKTVAAHDQLRVKFDEIDALSANAGECVKRSLNEARTMYLYNKFVVLALVVVLLLVAYAYWPKTPKEKSMEDKKGKNKKGRGAAKRGASQKSKKNRFWKSIYCQGFDKIRDGDDLVLIDEKGAKRNITTSTRDKELAEIDAIIAKNPGKYKVRVQGRDYDIKKVSTRFVMGKKNESAITGSSMAGAYLNSSLKTIYVLNIPVFSKSEVFMTSNQQDVTIDTFVTDEINDVDKLEEGFVSWLNAKAAEIPIEGVVEGCCHQKETCPLKDKRPTNNGNKCCNTKCGGASCSHWAGCSVKKEPSTGVEVKTEKSAPKESKSKKQEKLNPCFSFYINGHCTRDGCKLAHSGSSKEECVKWAASQTCNKSKCDGKSCLFKHEVTKSKDQIAVEKERLKSSVAAQVAAEVAKIATEKKGESMLGRKKTKAVHPAHKSVVVLYANDGVTPFLHGFVARNCLWTINHNGSDLQNMKSFIVKGDNGDEVVKCVDNDNQPTFKECVLERYGNLVCFKIPKGLLSLPQLNCAVVNPRADLILLTKIPEPQISYGCYQGKFEHTCPSVEGDCGSPILDNLDRVVGVHNAGGHNGEPNGFVEFTLEVLKMQNFQ